METLAWVYIGSTLLGALIGGNGRRALRGRGQSMYNILGREVSSGAQLDLLRHRLNMAEFLVIAWTAGYARGVDFSSSGERIIELDDPAHYLSVRGSDWVYFRSRVCR